MGVAGVFLQCEAELPIIQNRKFNRPHTFKPCFYHLFNIPQVPRCLSFCNPNICEGAVQVHRLNTEIHDITQLPYWHSNIYCQGVPYTLYTPSRNDLCLSYVFFFCLPLHKGYLMETPKRFHPHFLNSSHSQYH